MRGLASTRSVLALALLAGGIPLAAAPQTPAPPAQAAPSSELPLRRTYVLGNSDQVLIRVPAAAEFESVPYRIDDAGELTLPLVGKVRAAGLNVDELERELTQRLKEFIVDPLVSITVTSFRADSIFLVGAFQRPGIHPLEPRRSLMDTISALGGLAPNAGRRIRITRRREQGRIDLPGAVTTPDGGTSVEIQLSPLFEVVNPDEDIVLEPFDVITAQRTEQVYVNGEVARPGPFEALHGESISLLQVLSLAGGLTPNANTKEIRVLRPVLGSNQRAEIRLNYTDVIEGRGGDFPLMPNDVLYVPRKAGFWSGFGRTALVIAPVVASTVLIIVFR